MIELVTGVLIAVSLIAVSIPLFFVVFLFSLFILGGIGYLLFLGVIYIAVKVKHLI